MVYYIVHCSGLWQKCCCVDKVTITREHGIYLVYYTLPRDLIGLLYTAQGCGKSAVVDKVTVTREQDI